jgi:mono/diheme cytochrome c family protein
MATRTKGAFVNPYLAVTSVLSAILVACSGSSVAGAPASNATTSYWQDVAPIYNTRCVRCHQEGGIAPFRLDDYAEAKAHAQAELAQVSAGTMPPYFMVNDGSCESFQDEVSLSASEKATIKAWVDNGAIEGSPVAIAKAERPALADAVDLKTPSFSPVAGGDALSLNDEYRCFLLDAPTASDAFLTGYDVTPGDPSIVHHVLSFVVDPQQMAKNGQRNADVMQALDAQSPDRLGWPCFGAAGEGVAVKSVPVTWAPGQGVVHYPAGMGVPVRATDKIVVQIHYNLAEEGSAGKTDSTALHLHFEDAVERQLAFLLPDALLDSLGNVDGDGKSMPDLLPPGQEDAKYTWSRSGDQIGLHGIASADLVAVMPHMHGRGLRQQFRAGTAGNLGCIAHLENWDFHWQEFYFYKTPPKLGAATQFELTCEYDTRGDSEPVLPGWGTRNEMCLSVMMLALPPR